MWEIISKSKKKGGLGVKDIFNMNISLLCKCWRRLENEDGLWQDIIKAKYLKGRLISSVKHIRDDSPTWTDLLKIRMVYLRGRRIHTRNGKKTLLWEDSWIIGKSICNEHPVLYDLCKNKQVTVQEMWTRNGRLNFSRWLPPSLFEDWMRIVEMTFSFNFEARDDFVSCSWSRKKIFTTKCVYNHLSSAGENNNFNHIWKSKLSYKIKIFTWLLEKGDILTKDNMIRRKWIGYPSCRFCDQLESIDHLFFQCPVAKCV